MSGWAGLISGIVEGMSGMGQAWAAKDENRIARHEGFDYDQMMWQKNYDMQKEFAQHGLSWKIQDAIDSGIHPLYALGGSGAAASVIPSRAGGGGADIGPGLSRAGQGFSRAVASAMGKQDEMDDAQLKLIESQTKENDARSGYYDSLSARTRNEGSPGMPPLNVTEKEQFSDSLQGKIEVKPSQLTSASLDDRSMTAGFLPGWNRYYLSNGVPIRMPYSQEGWFESWSEASWYDKLIILAHNQSYYGEDWYKKAFKGMFGGPPPKKYKKTYPSQDLATSPSERR